MMLRTRFTILTMAAALAGCAVKVPNPLNLGNSASGLRALETEERLQDFDRVAQAVLDFYGPRSYKEKKFGYKVKDLAAEYRQRVMNATTDEEAFGITKQFLTRLQDGHVSLLSTFGPGSLLAEYSIPLRLLPVDGHAMIEEISDPTISKAQGIEVGDEVVAIDGKSPFELLGTVRKYETYGNEISDQHLVNKTLHRPAYMTELKPNQPTVKLTIEKPNGMRMERSLVWTVDRYRDQLELRRRFPGIEALNVSLAPTAQDAATRDRDSEVPFFMSDAVQTTFNVTRVAPTAKTMQKFGLKADQPAPNLYAAMLTAEDTTVLLIRQATYLAGDYVDRLAWYKAVVEDFSRFADVVVIDQTRNPGGFIPYALDFVSIFANQKTRGLVHFFHPDRLWLKFLGNAVALGTQGSQEPTEIANTFALAYKTIEEAYDKKLDLTERPVTFLGHEYLQPAGVQLNKPVLMLVDEKSGSCGDIVPLLMQSNSLATIFGERTMGLGGNVMQVLSLPNFSADLSLTRGLFTVFSPEGKYDLAHMPENNGVTPDIPYRHTLQDVRAGYVGYVKAFLKAAADLKGRSK